MRESSKIDKTKLPVDTYEGWLKGQNRKPEGKASPEKHTAESYDVWIGKRVETKTLKNTAKRKRTAG